MLLRDALRIHAGDQIAFVGSGGKTSAMFQLARQLTPPVWVTATSHLAIDQLQLANSYHILAGWSDLENFIDSVYKENVFKDGVREGVGLLIGPQGDSERMHSLADDMVEEISSVARQSGIHLLIEADGSRRKPLKAPAVHEPPIPQFVDGVVVVTGLDGLGQVLSPEYVHRVEIFGHLAGISPGEIISRQALGAVLKSPEGGLKNIPTGARRWLLMNQADDPARLGNALWLAQQLKDDFEASFTASLANRPGEVLARFEKVAGIVLAAGDASRFGKQKLLLNWNGEPLIRRIVQTALQSSLDPVVVVVGADAVGIQAAVHDLPVQIAHNPEWQQGQSSSVRYGIKCLPDDVGAAIFLLGDQPQISVGLLRGLVEKHAVEAVEILAPMIEDRRANPVLFDRRMFLELQGLTGDVGGRALFRRHRVDYLEWFDRVQLLDIDTQNDYLKLRELLYPGEIG